MITFVFWKDPSREKMKEEPGDCSGGYCSNAQEIKMGWPGRAAMRVEREPT